MDCQPFRPVCVVNIWESARIDHIVVIVQHMASRIRTSVCIDRSANFSTAISCLYLGSVITPSLSILSHLNSRPSSNMPHKNPCWRTLNMRIKAANLPKIDQEFLNILGSQKKDVFIGKSGNSRTSKYQGINCINVLKNQTSRTYIIIMMSVIIRNFET